MLQLFSSAKCFRLPYKLVSSLDIRYLSDKCNKGEDKTKVENKKPEELKCKTKKDATKASNSAECSNKKAPPPNCPPKPCKKTKSSGDHASFWKRVTLMGVFPLIAALTILVFTSHHEDERPEYKFWPHMYKRSKPFFFGGDGNHSYFHNPYWNALPPEGYEDEIDVGAEGKPAETDKEREQRMKEFAAVQKEWKQLDAKRAAEAKKAQAAAEKEAKRQQAEEEKAEKARRAEEEKERKQKEAEEKKIKAEEEKQRKRVQVEFQKQQAAEEKERKRLEAIEQKRPKKESKSESMRFFFDSEREENPPE